MMQKLLNFHLQKRNSIDGYAVNQYVKYHLIRCLLGNLGSDRDGNLSFSQGYCYCERDLVGSSLPS